LALAAIAYAPDQSLNFIATRFYNTSDLSISNIQGAALDHNSLTIKSLTIGTPDYAIAVTGLSVSFELAALFRGKLDKVTLAEVTLGSADEGQGQGQNRADLIEQPNTLTDWITVLATPPVNELVVDTIHLFVGGDEVTGSLNFTASPGSLRGQFSVARLPALKLSLSSTVLANDSLDISLNLTQEFTAIAQTQATLTIEEDSAVLISDSELRVQELLSLAQSFDLLPQLQSSTLNLHAQTKFRINTILTSPQITELELAMNNQAGLLSLLQGSEQDRVKLAATLPVTLKSNSLGSEQLLNLYSSDIDLSVTGESAPFQFQATLNASDLKLTCGINRNCKLSTTITAAANELRAPAWSVASLAVNANLEMDLAGESVVLKGSNSTLQLTTGTYGEAVTSFTASLPQWQINADASEPLSARTQVELSDWTLAYGDYTLNQPHIRGLVTLSSDEFSAALAGRLQTDLLVNSQLTANLASGSGSLAFDMPRLNLTAEQPLASYIRGAEFPLDIIAGAIAATGEVSWAPDDDLLMLSGPLSLQAENLSGVWDDSYFVGLSTELSAQFTGPSGLKTSGLQSASISTAELGLAINAISWDYEFDSTANSMALYQVTGNLLGGKISIPEAKFQDFTSDTTLTVVISDLDLNQVTALAEYPELQVQGFVSGYLPIKVASGTITMQEGLVSALNPGGSIRYTPLSPSTNSNVKLVNDALSNYQFKSLDSELFYDETGDLNLQVQLRGGNPDMPGGQQINLNLGIVNNIPDMLNSLRASRSITQALEKNLQRRR
jgi:hypothetical protein